jgi:hypothetical protein
MVLFFFIDKKASGPMPMLGPLTPSNLASFSPTPMPLKRLAAQTPGCAAGARC